MILICLISVIIPEKQELFDESLKTKDVKLSSTDAVAGPGTLSLFRVYFQTKLIGNANANNKSNIIVIVREL